MCHPLVLTYGVSPICFPLYFVSGFNIQLFLGDFGCSGLGVVSRRLQFLGNFVLLASDCWLSCLLWEWKRMSDPVMHTAVMQENEHGIWSPKTWIQKSSRSATLFICVTLGKSPNFLAPLSVLKKGGRVITPYIICHNEIEQVMYERTWQILHTNVRCSSPLLLCHSSLENK